MTVEEIRANHKKFSGYLGVHPTLFILECYLAEIGELLAVIDRLEAEKKENRREWLALFDDMATGRRPKLSGKEAEDKISKERGREPWER